MVFLFSLQLSPSPLELLWLWLLMSPSPAHASSFQGGTKPRTCTNPTRCLQGCWHWAVRGPLQDHGLPLLWKKYLVFWCETLYFCTSQKHRNWMFNWVASASWELSHFPSIIPLVLSTSQGGSDPNSFLPLLACGSHSSFKTLFQISFEKQCL